MLDPASMSPGSIMPPFNWLIEHRLDTSHLQEKIRQMQKLGVPYPPGYDRQAGQELISQADSVSTRLRESAIESSPDREIVALIAYLQRLGTDIKGQNKP